ncbi:hypothetical protein D5086_002712 [Populus alba]|uniref:Uncharacterized protein n=1 Tax=Populus alba TaxID=43335 RepID=A0ACC4D2I3_POPAL
MPQGQRRSQQNECQFDRINALDPARKIRSEAGVTEIWDENDQQFQCAAVVVIRHTINQRGLLLPAYSNTPKLIYAVQRHSNHQDSILEIEEKAPKTIIRRNSSWLATHNKKYKAKEAQTREAIMKAKVEDASRKDIATSSVASMSDYSQKLSTLTPD